MNFLPPFSLARTRYQFVSLHFLCVHKKIKINSNERCHNGQVSCYARNTPTIIVNMVLEYCSIA